MVKEGENSETGFDHHGLIRLLVENDLAKINQMWDVFVEISPSQEIRKLVEIVEATRV
jgi:hypothetical protein